MNIEIKQLTVKTGVVTYDLTIGKDVNIANDNIVKVSKISYCRKGYNKGYQGDFPAYKVEFEDSPFKLIIPEKTIESMLVEKVEKAKKTIPELPDDIINLPEEVEMTKLTPIKYTAL